MADRHARMPKPSEPSRQPALDRSSSPGLSSTRSAFVANRTEPALQWDLAASASPSPVVQALRKRADLLNSSPRVRAQHALTSRLNAPAVSGMHSQLKPDVESLSSLNMGDVQVHHVSAERARTGTLALDGGGDIHLGPDQERNLPHDAWRVVQQKQARVRPGTQMADAEINDEALSGHEADRMDVRALAMSSEPSQSEINAAHNSTDIFTQDYSPSTLMALDGHESSEPIQRKKRPASVTWAFTHLVKAQDDSLFHEDHNWSWGEVAPDQLGQLSRNQIIIVDEESIFMSRRGANQEVESRRQEDKNLDELTHKWFKVLQIQVDGTFEPAPDNSYVRAETINFNDIQTKENKKITIHTHGKKDEKNVSDNLEGFELAWQGAAGRRRRSVGHYGTEVPENETTESGDEITSGWNWDAFDEGVNVANDMKDPKIRTDFETGGIEKLEKQEVLSANYDEQGNEPVAYLVLEWRKNEFDQKTHMYIRWLIGHPEKRGGGQALVNRAISLFKESGLEEMHVSSAYSAVKWYESLGFKKVDPLKEAKKRGVGYADTELVYKKS